MENQENATDSKKAALSPKQTLARVELQGLVLKSISTLAELLHYCRRAMPPPVNLLTMEGLGVVPLALASSTLNSY